MTNTNPEPLDVAGRLVDADSPEGLHARISISDLSCRLQAYAIFTMLSTNLRAEGHEELADIFESAADSWKSPSVVEASLDKAKEMLGVTPEND
jgi:hypothetical protein